MCETADCIALPFRLSGVTRRIGGVARSAGTTIAVGDESSRNPRIGRNAISPRSGATTRAKVLWCRLRGTSAWPACPWVPRGLVTHGYCCSGATRRGIETSDPLELTV